MSAPTQLQQQQEYYQLRQKASDLLQACDDVSRNLTSAQDEISSAYSSARQLVESAEQRSRHELLETEEVVMGMMSMTMELKI